MWIIWQIIIVFSLVGIMALTENRIFLIIIALAWLIESFVALTFFSTLQIFQILVILLTTGLLLEVKN